MKARIKLKLHQNGDDKLRTDMCMLSKRDRIVKNSLNEDSKTLVMRWQRTSGEMWKSSDQDIGQSQ
jgi:hypothetical protein